MTVLHDYYDQDTLFTLSMWDNSPTKCIHISVHSMLPTFLALFLPST